MMGQILIVDDEDIVLRSCQRILRGEDYGIDVARDGFEALAMVGEKDYDVLVLDIMMPKMDGIEVLRRVKESHPEIEVLMITGLNEIGTAVKAMKLGAFDYLPKPFEPNDLKQAVARAFERRNRMQQGQDPTGGTGANYHFENVIGESPAMQRVFRLVALGKISRATQAKLLRFIEEREFKAVGGTGVKKVDIRLITATNKDLEAMVADGEFRDDLYYRINVFPIQIPPLRDRREDIPLLVRHFLERFNRDLPHKSSEFSAAAMNLLLNYGWPGNVRELENVVQRALILAGGDIIRQGHLANIIDALPQVELDVPRTGEELKQIKKLARQKSVETVEKQFVLGALKRNGWNVTRAAEETGMQRSNFQAMMAKYDIRIRGADAEKPEDNDA
jgi:DNA-binding NtrC family response regulator